MNRNRIIDILLISGIIVLLVVSTLPLVIQYHTMTVRTLDGSSQVACERANSSLNPQNHTEWLNSPGLSSFHPTRPNSSFCSSSSTNETVGRQETFWVWDYEDLRFEQRNATLLVVGEKCYVYMANLTIDVLGEPAAIARSENYAAEFDLITLDKNVELIGHPNGYFGDIDGDPRVTIMLTPLVLAGGCYWSKDEDRSDPYSNLREMIYLDSVMTEESGYGVMMHEFNHLIFFNHDLDEGHFLTEGIAEYARYYAGYLTNTSWGPPMGLGDNLSLSTVSFTTDYEKSLLSWHIRRSLFLSSDYGKAYMFVFYLAEQFGSEFLKTLVNIPSDGPQGIDFALAVRGIPLTFNEVFLNWITACSIDNEAYNNSTYGFRNADFKIHPTYIRPSFEKTNQKHYYYGFHTKKVINPPDEFTFRITKPQTYALGISIIIQDQNGWHVTQNIHSEPSEWITEYIAGEGIVQAYIITSVMRKNTPQNFRNIFRVGQDPYLPLNYSIVEGYVSESEPSISSSEPISGFTVGLVTVFNAFLGACIRYRKKWRQD